MTMSDEVIEERREEDQQPIARMYFSAMRTLLDGKIRKELTERQKKKKDWRTTVAQAERDLEIWQTESGRAQNYTPHELAEARVAKGVVSLYEAQSRRSLFAQNAAHQAHIAADVIAFGLAERMIAKGREGEKLSVLEISSRLAPVLTFPGSSAYFEMAALPYGTHAREVLGEEKLPHYVSQAAAQASARNMHAKFGTHYVLAETSAAPRSDVSRSRRPSELYVCSLVGSEMQETCVQFPEVQLRAEFDARVREVIYQHLIRMYQMK